MAYRYSVRKGVEHIKTKTVIAISAFGLALGGGAMSLAVFGSANALTVPVNGCVFDEAGNTWTLQGDCTSTDQIEIPANTTVDGNGYTIAPNFTKGDSSHNAAIGITSADGVTINNLKIDGTSGTNLHGINIYTSVNVNLNNVTVTNNDHNGIVVNGSVVTVLNITTMNNGWGGIDVDLGSGVSGPASLTVNGHSTQTDAWQIYVDNTTKNVSVNDTLGQYAVSHPGVQPNDELYTLKSPTSKEECKKDGWMHFSNPTFKNQGQCVSWTNGRGN